jgi:hypothetical protein
MQLVNVSDGRFHLSREVWVYFAVTIPLTFITIMGCWFGMRRKEASQQQYDFQDSHAPDAFDLESGVQMNDFK